jgi:hypothetical protein
MNLPSRLDRRLQGWLDALIWKLKFFGVLLLSTSLFASALRATESAPEFLWVTNAGSADLDQGFGLTVDVSGQVYQTGFTSKNASFGETTFTTNGFFVSKRDPSGQIVWVIQDGIYPGFFGGAVGGWSVGVDASSNVFVLCNLNASEAVFGGQTITNQSAGTLVLLKYNGNGSFVWAKPICWGNFLYASGLAVDSEGNCFFAAISWEGFAAIPWEGGAQTATTNLTGGVLVAKCNSDGNLVWIKSFGSSSNFYVNVEDLALGGTNGIYVFGHFLNSLVIDGTTLSGGNNNNVFLAKFTSDGQLQWAKQSTGTNTVTSNRLAVDSDGNAFVNGVFRDNITFDTVVLSNAVAANYYFLTKYDPAGNAIWAKSLGIGGSRSAMTVDRAGNCYAGAEISGGSNVFTKFDPAGNLLWTKVVPSAKFIFFQLAADSVGNCFFSGSLYDTTAFDGQTVTGIGSRDVLLGKLNTSTPPPLNILSQGDSVQLSWPSLASGFHLESSPNLDAPLSWASNSATVNMLGLTNVATVSVKSNQMFFRLTRP